ncbi:tyrosine-type recombinase/integrase [Methylobacterium gnaphalii]|uniref:Integrase n=1 Tax=Methylobacterium gnaphalii TaxID=1010610 RepID=A0A512JNA7_9HYPH|nr:tyrosine-type recombinase/integrase [Methylobacterium gnaphalii]GEP11445.1 integrase [Methylobacterium gnaphalii]GJD70219.1 hypothetical protein MMMDOFMJ_3161 [Methylobacterium gnaphalii]GLS50544.1 integrase [Methylobacterium gnaphalii]
MSDLADYLTARAGIWHYARRVPAAFAEFDPRGVIRQSTKIRVIDDPRKVRAARAAARINSELEAYWRDGLRGDAVAARARYDKVRRDARRLGFEYISAVEVSQRPIEEILQRFEALAARNVIDDKPAEAALLGTVPAPALELTGLFDEFETLMKASLRTMSEDQLRKWRNPKKRAIANFIKVVGNKAVAQLTRADALDFQRWWQARVIAEDMEIETANKDIGHLNKMLRKVEHAHQMQIGPIFAQMRIEGGTTGQRVAFDPKFVQDELLKDGALDGLNDEARRVLYLISETGLRLSEACNLTRETIKLDAAVPHVMVRPNGRKMKTEQSERDIPLVGVALEAMKLQPDGFPRYRHKSDSLSALVNKFLDSKKLLREDGQTLYSLRHTFEDRLTAVEAPDKLAAALMGHKYHRPRYGVGPSLAQKREWLEKIAFKKLPAV